MTSLLFVAWAGFVFAFVSVCRNKGLRALIPILFGTVAGVLAVSMMEITASRGLWPWLGIITAFVVVVSIFVPRVAHLDYDGLHGLRIWSGFQEHHRNAIVIAVLFVALAGVYLFAKLALGIFNTGAMRPGGMAY